MKLFSYLDQMIRLTSNEAFSATFLDANL